MQDKKREASAYRRYVPILLALVMLGVLATVVIIKKKRYHYILDKTDTAVVSSLGLLSKQKSCVELPKFLTLKHITQPVIIDLSQKRFKGVALLYGKNFKKVFHPKQWEQYGHMGTYTLDKYGNIYLAPIPFISIDPTTFNLQKNIYKIDTHTGKLSIFMHLDDVVPSASNPYGIVALTYDCDDKSLWISAIDESDYHAQKGVIYHIDVQTKKILQKMYGFDALSLTLTKTSKGKMLLAGAARENVLYGFFIQNNRIRKDPFYLFALPKDNERIRKIKVENDNKLKIETIPFSYALIAQSTQYDRNIYYLKYSIQEKNFLRINNF